MKPIPWDDTFAVYISADGESWTSLYTIPTTGTEMVTNTIEFSSTSDYADYVGGTYYLAFMKSGYAWYNVYIDNITGPEIVEPAIEFELTDFALVDDGTLAKIGNTLNFTATVTNNGDEGVDSVFLTIDDVKVDTAVTGTLASGESETVSLSWTPGTSTTSASLTALLPDDDATDNNTLSLSLTIYPEATDSNIALDFTIGSFPDFWNADYENYCGWTISSYSVPPYGISGYDGNFLNFGASYTAYNNLNFTSTLLSFPSDLYKVSFYMYRDASTGDDGKSDSVNVRFNTRPDTTGSTLVGTVCRSINDKPVVETAGWYYYEYFVDASSFTEGFLVLEGATSGSGYNMFIDNLSIIEYPAYNASLTAIETSEDILWGTSDGAKGDLTVALDNKGENDLTSATIKWEIDGVAQEDFAWTGNLATDESEQVLIAEDFAFPVNAIDTLDIKAYVVLTDDADLTNDSVTTTVITKEAYALNYVNTFEIETLDQWLNIDGDGDGYTWEIATTNPYDGVQHISSSSYVADADNPELKPNNWLITPGLSINADSVCLSYYVGSIGEGGDYYAETYEILVSSEGIDTASFVSVYGETLTSTDYKKVTITLNDYKGQVINIAFKHHGSTNQTSLDIDSLNVYIKPHTVSLTANLDEAGTLSGAGSYIEGETVSLTATANDGYSFVNWSSNDDVLSTEASFSFTMGAADTALVAVFEETAFTVTFNITSAAGEVADASIAITETEDALTTDANGEATLELTAGTYTYVISADNYKDTSNTFTVDGSDLNVDVYLYADASGNVGISENVSSITVYPNPFAEVLNIASDKVISDVQVLDIKGNLCVSETINAKSASLALNVEAGAYIVVLSDESGNKQMYQIVKK